MSVIFSVYVTFLCKKLSDFCAEGVTFLFECERQNRYKLSCAIPQCEPARRCLLGKAYQSPPGCLSPLVCQHKERARQQSRGTAEKHRLCPSLLPCPKDERQTQNSTPAPILGVRRFSSHRFLRPSVFFLSVPLFVASVVCRRRAAIPL